ncbi:MAG: hypothetical protein R2864_10760 [Syntrophotaleaceae bacterium]
MARFLGLGVKDFRAVFVFHDTETMNRFTEKGWAFGGQADAAAKASDKGAAVGGEAVIDNITIYQLTESGLASRQQSRVRNIGRMIL